MRDHSKRKAFHLADELAVLVYEATRCFPRDKLFGLRAQMRRAAVSVASNIVEGCARRTQADSPHFLDIAFGSFRELEYQVSLARRLGYLRTDAHRLLQAKCTEISKVLAARIRSLRGIPSQPNSLTA
jgi:four helix bundle protein